MRRSPAFELQYYPYFIQNKVMFYELVLQPLFQKPPIDNPVPL